MSGVGAEECGGAACRSVRVCCWSGGGGGDGAAAAEAGLYSYGGSATGDGGVPALAAGERRRAGRGPCAEAGPHGSGTGRQRLAVAALGPCSEALLVTVCEL